MDLKRGFGILVLGLSFSSCSIMKIDESQAKRNFNVRAVWVKRTTAEENLRVRKVNRMVPIRIGADLILQGNGIDGLTAHQAVTGDIVWRKNIRLGIEPSATEFKGRLYVAASDGHFYCLNSKNGEEIWNYDTKSENLSEPLLDLNTGTVFFASSNNVVYALEAESGRKLWIYSRQDTSPFSIRGGARPTLKDSTLYLGFSDGTLVALNAKSGSVLWENQLNKNKKFKDLDSTPVLDEDRLYVAGYDDRLYCLSAQKGDVIWKVDGGSYSPVAILGQKLFYSTTEGQVVAINKNNGEKIWSYKLDGIGTEVRFYKGLVVFGESQGSLVFLDTETGKNLGHFEPGRGILAPPAIDEKNNRLYFISSEANLYAIEAVWQRRDPSQHVQ